MKHQQASLLSLFFCFVLLIQPAVAEYTSKQAGPYQAYMRNVKRISQSTFKSEAEAVKAVAKLRAVNPRTLASGYVAQSVQAVKNNKKFEANVQSALKNLGPKEAVRRSKRNRLWNSKSSAASLATATLLELRRDSQKELNQAKSSVKKSLSKFHRSKKVTSKSVSRKGQSERDNNLIMGMVYYVFAKSIQRQNEDKRYFQQKVDEFEDQVDQVVDTVAKCLEDANAAYNSCAPQGAPTYVQAACSVAYLENVATCMAE